MNQTVSDTYARQLQQMRTDLLAQLRAQRGGQVGRAEAAAEAREHQSDDWAQADAERDLSIAMEERESAGLIAIDEALKRIGDGSYGLCIDCGASIATARLHANPTALRRLPGKARKSRRRRAHARLLNPHPETLNRSRTMTTFHAVVWMDHSQAHVLMFDKEHVEAQRVKARAL